jgi:hypothetical protein
MGSAKLIVNQLLRTGLEPAATEGRLPCPGAPLAGYLFLARLYTGDMVKIGDNPIVAGRTWPMPENIAAGMERNMFSPLRPVPDMPGGGLLRPGSAPSFETLT